MLQQVRQAEILKIAETDGSVIVNDLAERLQCSKETIRRDITALTKQHLLVRTYGGALYSNAMLSVDHNEKTSTNLVSNEHPIGKEQVGFYRRKQQNAEAKMALAKIALSHIQPHDFILLDGSSTSWFLARQLPDITMTVLTPSLEHIHALASKSNIRLVCLGGDFSPTDSCFLGKLAQRALSEFNVDKLFISCSGYNEEGISETSQHTMELKRTMIEVSKKVYLLADNAKYKNVAPYQCVGFNKIDVAILDNEPGADLRREFAWNNVTPLIT
ncbi:DeoR/GlpR family DNA-binding transcription regulator [Vibrio rumoiensis]|uniref:DeoR/GlpR family DNA-binding transcription regulator n=1 Tax=Vibrio rumoiensis TaxID=76258 RepID=UPI000B5C2A5C|nr:DeoR/GlpR family DNA-binding transcription regulator [Vibrio rumoiensis]